jgi:hypothetical protein
MGRPSLDTERLNIKVMRTALRDLRADCADKGYVNGNGILLGAYLGAIAQLVRSGKLKVPRNNS